MITNNPTANNIISKIYIVSKVSKNLIY